MTGTIGDFNHMVDNMKKKDSEWREASIIEYAYLVKQIASGFAVRLPSSVFFDELVSAGSLGLIDAVDKFDPDRHVSLKTYARHRIRGAILDELRSMDTYTRSMRKKIQDIEKASKQIEDKKKRPALDEEISEAMGLDLEAYYDTLTDIHGAAVLSLDSFIKTKNNESRSRTRFGTVLKSKSTPEDHLDEREIQSVLADAVKKLSEKEQLVVSLYYYDELTLKEIGEVLSLTESRICQINAGVLIKLKTRLESYWSS